MTSPRPAFLIDLFDTLVVIDIPLYNAGRRALASELGVDEGTFIKAWRASDHEAQMGTLATTRARCRQALANLGMAPDEAMIAKLAALDVEHLFRASRLYPGAAEFLELIRGRFPGRLALVSNAAANGRDLLRHLGLEPRFDALIFSFETGLMKPQPEIYQRALRDVGGDAAVSWFMGDGAGRELEGAASAGLKPLRIDHPEKFSLLRGNVGETPQFPLFKSFDEVILHLDQIT